MMPSLRLNDDNLPRSVKNLMDCMNAYSVDVAHPNVLPGGGILKNTGDLRHYYNHYGFFWIAVIRAERND